MFKIEEKQLQEIINILAEAPAKYVYNVIFALQNLEKVEEEKEDKD